MKAQRRQACITLIEELLNCPSGEEIALLQENRALLDSDLLQAVEEIAAWAQAEGRQELAESLGELYSFIQTQAKALHPSGKERRRGYWRLIEQLLTCPSGEEEEILTANADLIDRGFLKACKAVAALFAQQGEEETAEFLRQVAAQLGAGREETNQTPQAYASFLQALLLAEYEGGGNPQPVYAILRDNLDKLDEGFRRVLRDWASAALNDADAEMREGIAGLIENLCIHIQSFPLGRRSENIEIAIAGYELVLHSRENNRAKWAQTQNNLAVAYSERILGERAENLENAIACFRAALDVYTRTAYPEYWATTQNNLGNAYSNSIGERAENLENAIACYRAALEVRTRTAYPEYWADTKNNQGLAYSSRILGERAKNIEKAIAYYGEALEIRTRKAYPEKWAETKNNLGNAYSNRILGERAENLENAIACYEEALKVRTRTACPENWATTQNNLGNAYRNRILGERAENLENAIACYEEALKVRTRTACPEYWADTKNNLGNAYSNRILGERAENLENALDCYGAALEVRTRKAYPEKWAETKNNLGNAYSNRILGERAENLENAIACYEEALKVRTRTACPEYWADTKNNLGNAYSNRILGERAENLENALDCYGAALEVRTRESFPQNHAETLFNLGLAYRDTRRLSDARQVFAAAIDTVEFLRGEIVSGEAAKQKLAEEYNRIYRSMVEVCLELGRDAEAIEYVERSKSRILVELLATRDLYPKGEIPDTVRNQLQRLRQEIAIEKRNLAAAAAPDYSRLTHLREEYNRLYPYEPIQFEQIQTLLDDSTAIIQWYIFEDCFRAFILTAGSKQPFVWKSAPEDLTKLVDWANKYLRLYNELKIALLQAKQAEITLKEAPDEAEKAKCLAQLIEAQAKSQQLHEQWDAGMAARLQQLAEILHLDEILAHLKEIFSHQPETCQHLILIPHRLLHLFPLHALPASFSDSKKSLLDGFQSVSYAPSCQLLAQVRKFHRRKFQHLIGIQNPTEDLIWASIEVETIRETFSQHQVLPGAAAKKSVLLRRDETSQKIEMWAELLSAHCLHFSCHGYFDFNAPLNSGLSLADGTLTLAEIFEHFNLSECSLVTLSACETGLIDFTNSSDEYYSLSAGMMMAGSPSVVISQWSVNQFSTALLLIKFYEELTAQPGTIAVSLNNAQRWLRDTTVRGFLDWVNRSQNLSRVWCVKLRANLTKMGEDKQIGWDANPFKSPYHWAGFCAVGQGEQKCLAMQSAFKLL